jgi:integrase
MPRRSQGPRLILRKDPDYDRPVYTIVWTENSRSKRKSTGQCDLAPAQAVFEEWLGQRRRQQQSAGPRDSAEVRVAELLEDYMQEHGSEVASPETLAYSCDPLRWFFRTDTVAALTTGRVKQYWTWRRTHSVTELADGSLREVKGGGGNGTIRRELGGALRPAIKHAIEQKRLILGEYYIPLPPAPAGRDYWITRPEAARLLWETRRDRRARLHLPLYALIALYTGQRRGAILDLTWKQVELVRGLIDFNPPGRLQTKKHRPIIPVPAPLVAALKRAQRRAASNHVIAYNGEPVKDVKTGFNSAADRAGIPECTSHTLRHTAGTWMAQRGVPLREIAGYLGHSETRTTELYAHHHPDYLKQARAALERQQIPARNPA